MKSLFLRWSSLLFLALLARPVFSDGAGTNTAAELIWRGRAELASNRWSAAEEDFRLAAEFEPTNSTAYAWLGASLSALNRRQEATAAYEKALELNPLRTNTWFYLAGSYYSLGNHEKAADAYQKYVSLSPGNDKAYYWLYSSLTRLKRYREAEKACRQAIAINPTNSVYYLSLGYCLNELGRYGEADKTLEKSLSLNPQDPDAHLWLGICRYHEKNYQQAISSLRKSLTLQPANNEADYWIGRSFAALSRYEQAVNAFREAVRIDPNDSQAHEWLGFSLLRLGRFDEATASIEKAYEIKKDKATRRALFCGYLLSAQYEKAYRLYPVVFAFGGGALLLSYLIELTALLRSSFKVSAEPSPRVGFSLAWLAVFFQGQIALIVCLALLSLIKVSENFLFAIILSGIPVILAAALAFARQPWGQPFSWPLRLGTVKVIGLSLVGLVVALSFGSWCVEWLARVMHRPVTVQETIPLIKYALSASPVAAILSIVMVGPIAEEIIFRGLIYGALEKRVRVFGAMLISSFLFALAHLQVTHFIPIFCLGMALSWARWKSGSLGLPILLHVLNNGVALLFLKLFEKF
ncbi:MAG: tetratricopeptide repeat protein [Verrucomicrobiia bacterium]|jgi:tetratricopeptide (TPR) repeat protein